MKSYSFFTSSYQKKQSPHCVAENTTKNGIYNLKIGEQSVVGDSYLRSHALKSASVGNYNQAITILNELINRHPLNAVDYNNRGLIYFQSGKLQKAFCDYNTALQLDPHLASAYNNRANYYAACGELDSALADYEKALDLNPSYVRAWINRGITLRDLKKYEEAVENFEIALLFGQLQGHVLAERGRTYHLWGDWNFAIADYQRALTQLPSPNLRNDDPSYRLRLRVENWLNDLLCCA